MPLARETILIADDFPKMREVIRRTCTSGSFDFIETGNGLEAVAAYEAHHPSWVIMDIEMPMMDGLTATRAILATQPSAKIIIITQSDSKAIREEAIAIGAHAFLTKDNLGDLTDILQFSSV